jgi:anti-sigma-K factor RskA
MSVLMTASDRAERESDVLGSHYTRPAGHQASAVPSRCDAKGKRGAPVANILKPISTMTENTSAQTPPCHANRWRAATIACLLILALGVTTGMSMFEQFKAQIAHLQVKLNTTAQIKYIAVLLDAQQVPALLVTFDPQDRALQLQRLNNVKEGPEDSMQLWALPATGKPVSLGILGSAGKTLRLPADDKTLVNVPQLAISVENRGGTSEDRGPRLPYLFSGAVVQKAL